MLGNFYILPFKVYVFILITQTQGLSCVLTLKPQRQGVTPEDWLSLTFSGPLNTLGRCWAPGALGVR